jgi:hypothetical protein
MLVPLKINNNSHLHSQREARLKYNKQARKIRDKIIESILVY